jgi:hypothetical protein
MHGGRLAAGQASFTYVDIAIRPEPYQQRVADAFYENPSPAKA